MFDCKTTEAGTQGWEGWVFLTDYYYNFFLAFFNVLKTIFS